MFREGEYTEQLHEDEGIPVYPLTGVTAYHPTYEQLEYLRIKQKDS